MPMPGNGTPRIGASHKSPHLAHTGHVGQPYTPGSGQATKRCGSSSPPSERL